MSRPLLPIKLSKITSNDRQPLLYIPLEAMRRLGLRRGDSVVIYVDVAEGTLLIKPVRREAFQNGC